MNFVNCTRSDVSSLVPIICLMGENLVGLELGVFEATSFMTLLHNCPNIKTLHGVDAYKPYDDYIKQDYDGTIAMTIDAPTIETVRAISFIRQKHSGMTEKIVFHEEDSELTVKKFEPETLDFIFLDAYLSYEHTKRDLESWFKIIKEGGLFAGHDWDCPAVQRAVNEFRFENGITSRMMTYNNTWAWIK